MRNDKKKFLKVLFLFKGYKEKKSTIKNSNKVCVSLSVKYLLFIFFLRMCLVVGGFPQKKTLFMLLLSGPAASWFSSVKKKKKTESLIKNGDITKIELKIKKIKM